MKKFVFLFCVLVSLTLCCVCAEAADVIFTFSSVTGASGDEVEITLSMESTATLNSVALSKFVYDTDALEFIAFENYEEIEKLSVLTPTYDKEKMAIVVGFKKKTNHCVDLCTMRFKIKADKVGRDYTVSATPVVKNSSVILSTEVNAGTVSVTSDAAAEGTSLILDGSIGVKTYFSIEENVDPATVTFIADEYDSTVSDIVKTVVHTAEDGIKYDAEKGMYYIVSYVAPKDANKREIRGTISYSNKDSEATYYAPAPAVSVDSYIEEFKELAKNDPESEYGAALNLVETIDTYTKYADSFFGGADIEEEVTVDTEAIEAVSDPVSSGKGTDIEFYATSLILENKTTIRHYFKVSDDFDASAHTFKVGNEVLTPVRKYGTDYIYVDIVGVAANDMDETYVLNVSDNISISYSVLNYVKLAMDSEDIKLANLVKALFNYYQQADLYAK